MLLTSRIILNGFIYSSRISYMCAMCFCHIHCLLFALSFSASHKHTTFLSELHVFIFMTHWVQWVLPYMHMCGHTLERGQPSEWIPFWLRCENEEHVDLINSTNIITSTTMLACLGWEEWVESSHFFSGTLLSGKGSVILSMVQITTISH